ncbi:MAG TPA: DUF2256 domain-containing protein [Falsiroseomonas sp.]|nr:DUF2256 domain-containing protein [Falsiroseomonas sp.]
MKGGGAHRKPFLPTKPCRVCARPFAWRKRWARDWDRVLYCSDACRRRRGTVSDVGIGLQPDHRRR